MRQIINEYIRVECFNSTQFQFKISSYQHSSGFRVSRFGLSSMFLDFWMCAKSFDWTVNLTFSVMIFVNRVYGWITSPSDESATLNVIIRIYGGEDGDRRVWGSRNLSHMHKFPLTFSSNAQFNIIIFIMFCLKKTLINCGLWS